MPGETTALHFPVRRILAAALLVAALALPSAASAQSFAPLAGDAGCVISKASTDETANTRCTKLDAMRDVIKLTVSPDDHTVYAATDTSILAFSRAADTGGLTYVSCVSDTGDDGRAGTDGACADGDALNGVRDIAVSPDGKFAYAASLYSNGVTWFSRDPATGSLKPAGCLKAAPRGDRCGGALNLMAPTALAISGDGKNVYVVSNFDAAIAVFRRDADTGALTPGGCVSDTGSDGRCVNGTALSSVSDVAISGDGASAFALAGGIALTSYGRDGATGELAPRACAIGATLTGSSCSVAPPLGGARDMVVAPNGQVIVADNANSAISVLNGDLSPASCYVHQDPAADDQEQSDDDEEGDEEDDTGDDEEDDTDDGEDEADEPEPANPAIAKCSPVKALASVNALALSSDGKALFASAGYGYVAAFSRNPGTGALTEFGCLEADPFYKSCASVDPSYYGSLATTSDGRNLYATIDEGVAVLSAAVAVTSRTAKMSRSGRIGLRLACPAQRTRTCRGSVGGARYRVARGAAATVQVRLPRRVRASVARHGRATVRVSARDADRTVRATRRTLRVSAR
jgi:DNA-binding beta-propeller fold protein YncE